MEVKVTIGFNQETLSLLESFVSSFGGSAKAKKTTVATNGAAGNGVAKTEPAKEEEPKQTAENTVTDNNVTIEQIRALVHTKTRSGYRDPIKALLAELGIEKVTELQPNSYSSFFEKVNAL